MSRGPEGSLGAQLQRLSPEQQAAINASLEQAKTVAEIKATGEDTAPTEDLTKKRPQILDRGEAAVAAQIAAAREKLKPDDEERASH